MFNFLLEPIMGKSEYDDCVFCKIGKAEENKLPEHDLPIIQTPDFFVVPALGQFTEGYVLICPKTHLLNLGTMDAVLFDRFLDLKEHVRTLLFEKYGRKPTFFEHGPASGLKRGGSCVDHAHLHAIPTDLDSIPDWVSENLEGGSIEDMNAVVEYAKTGKPYFFLECPDGTKYLYNARALPCQYGRQLFAREFGALDKWDWHYHPFIEKMIETRCHLRDQVKKKPGK